MCDQRELLNPITLRGGAIFFVTVLPAVRMPRVPEIASMGAAPTRI
ncbi:membrane protein [Mycobacterium phage phiGD20-1]|nr:membrane protein [Mycobacterium phage phiGD23-1]QPO17664.1 membrane protein [Mycobacterium phage phiGD22-1]QPO17845.1 membrane protein [Mycobacterium phage phiGD20-1]